MSAITLQPLDLVLAASLLLVLAGLSVAQGLGLGRQILVAGARSLVQLSLVGLVLESLFAHVSLAWLGLVAVFMLSAAGYEVRVRQQRKLRGVWGYGVGAVSMFLSTFTVALLALVVLIQPDPWFAPRYSIPLLGMLLGNTMTGVALGLDRLFESTWRDRRAVEARLALGWTAREATADLRRSALRAALTPILNSMAAAGVVSLPGMMTGQILGGAAPLEAVKYQLLILFLIAGGTGLGSWAAVHLGSRRLFDERERLRLERLGEV